jgi:hypothetical protein
MKPEIRVSGCKDWGCKCAKCAKMPLMTSNLRNCMKCKDDNCPDKKARPCTIDDIETWREKELVNTYHKPVTHGNAIRKNVEPKNLEFNW